MDHHRQVYRVGQEAKRKESRRHKMGRGEEKDIDFLPLSPSSDPVIE